MKKLSGTIGMENGVPVRIPHILLDPSKILMVNVTVSDDNGNYNQQQYDDGVTDGGYNFAVFWDSENIHVTPHEVDSDAILERPISILVIYEE